MCLKLGTEKKKCTSIERISLYKDRLKTALIYKKYMEFPELSKFKIDISLPIDVF
ncbi:hypothetical protein AAGS39_36090 [Flavobacterium sp. CGRL2]